MIQQKMTTELLERPREREDERNAFQRESILALQSAVSDLVKSVYDEQDRMLVELEKTQCWPVRQWETPTAAGWADAQMRLEMLRARVFNKKISELAGQIRTVSRKPVWAENIDDAKRSNELLGRLFEDLNKKVENSFAWAVFTLARAYASTEADAGFLAQLKEQV